jgi:hypothetical protein
MQHGGYWLESDWIGDWGKVSGGALKGSIGGE